MISVQEAQTLCLDLVRPTPPEDIPLGQALGRTLVRPVTALRDQPPFSASAMDGYAVGECAQGDVLDVVGESAAGHGWDGTVGPNEAVRIFTGAPVPKGATRVVIQENVARSDNQITLVEPLTHNINIRPQGADFERGLSVDAPVALTPAHMALIAAMNHPKVSVARAPKVALLSNGDELVMPGGDPSPNQIIASNVFALQAMVEQAGGVAHVLPIAPDLPEALDQTLTDAAAWGADVIVTIGGASVGDHDLVAPALDRFGVTRSFHKIAMRPGKPLMAGSKGDIAFLGLPGNPVSAIVCGHLFLVPMIRRALGQGDVFPPALSATLTAPLPAGGPRAHYMRARYAEADQGRIVTAHDKQDSSMLTVLAGANCLLLRPIDDGPKQIGDSVTIYPI